MKSIPPKRKKKVYGDSIAEAISEIGDKFAQHLNTELLANFIATKDLKPLTEKEKKAIALREKKEKIRRAKKKVITVGEYEDLLEASYY